MKLVRISDLREGMVVADNIYESGGSAIPLMSKGVVLNKDYIHRLQTRSIAFVYVEMPDNYQGAPGETLELLAINKDISFEGKLKINGDIPQDIKIEAGGSIVINGSINKNCLITSLSGAIKINGNIIGEKELPVKIAAPQKIYLKSAEFTEIRTNGDVNIAGDISDCSVTARGEIEVTGKANRVELYSQTKILLGECGNQAGDPSSLTVRPIECRELFNELLKIDAKVSELGKEKSRLQNIIDLIKKLGKEIEQLSQAKKQEMATGVKRFREIDGEISSVQSRKVQIKDELEGHLGLKRIIILGNLFPGIKIAIENSRIDIAKQDQRIAFYMKDFKIVSSAYSAGFQVG